MSFAVTTSRCHKQAILRVALVTGVSLWWSACAIILRDSKTYVGKPARPLPGVALKVKPEPLTSRFIPPYPIVIGVIAVRGPCYWSAVSFRVRNDRVTRVKLSAAKVRSPDLSWQLTLRPRRHDQYRDGEWEELSPARSPPLFPAHRGFLLTRYAGFSFGKWGPVPQDLETLIITVSFALDLGGEIAEFTEEIELLKKHRIFAAPTVLMR